MKLMQGRCAFVTLCVDSPHQAASCSSNTSMLHAVTQCVVVYGYCCSTCENLHNTRHSGIERLSF